MDEILNEQEETQKNSSHATPFNVDLFGSKPKNYFTEYTRRILSLPESIRNIVTDPSTADFIEDNIGSNFNLTSGQKTEITRIIRDVLLGDLFIGEMSQNISARMKLAPDEAKRTRDLIISELFKPATDDIKKLQTEIFPEKINRPIPERPDLKIEPDINRSNIVDLRNK